MPEAGTDEPIDELVEDERRQVQEVAEELPEGDRERLYDLVQTPAGLDEGKSRELARILLPLYSPSSFEEVPADQEPPTEEELLQVWGSLARGAGPDREAPADDWGTAEAPEMDLQAAGLFKLDPRDILRAFTVYKMKDRAGTVGALGVGPLLIDLLTATEAAFHLVGHSYGAKVLLSSICQKPLPRSVTSLLLLQPAINYLCFAKEVPNLGRPGGYRSALDRVEQPILSTFSAKDDALHRFFHLALRRSSDLGELRIAAPGAAPSIYAALGGYGPGGLDEESAEVAIKKPGEPYELSTGTVRVWGVNAMDGIGSHSDVTNEWTFWALHSQVHR